MRTCRRFLVSGRVQGVAYRAWTRMEASALGLTGWAANLRDGRVEVLVCGDDAAIERLRALLDEGPPAARVAAVEEIDPGVSADAAPPGFATR
jgi:acylphosphatase